MGHTVIADPARDAFALQLAWLDDDMDRIALLLEPYRLGTQELHLLAAVLATVGLQRDPAELRELFYGVALAGARRPT